MTHFVTRGLAALAPYLPPEEADRVLADLLDALGRAEPISVGILAYCLEELGPHLFQLMVDVCNGQLTDAEIIGHQEFAIHKIGPAAIEHARAGSAA